MPAHAFQSARPCRPPGSSARRRPRDTIRSPSIQRLGEHGDEKLAMPVGNALSSACELARAVIHGGHSAGQQIPRPAGSHQSANRVGKVGRRILHFAVKVRIDDGAARILMPRAEAAQAVQHLQNGFVIRLRRMPRPRGQMVVDGLRRCGAEQEEQEEAQNWDATSCDSGISGAGGVSGVSGADGHSHGE